MAQQPLISIIIPVHNAAGMLGRCLDSIDRLTYTNYEVLLVDDGSTDESPALCDARAQREGRYRVIHQENQGAAGARNRGLEEAHGRYLLFADCDDEVDPQLASELLAKAEEGPYDLVICGYDRIDKQGSVISHRIPDPGLTGGLRELISAILVDELFPSPWAKLFSRKVFGSLRFTEGHQFEDALIWSDVIRTVDDLTFATVGTCLYRYRYNPAGLMRTYHGEEEEHLVDAWKQVCDAFEERFGRKGAPEVVYRRTYSCFEVIDRAIVHGHAQDSPLYRTALQELKEHRAEVCSSPYYTKRRKQMLRLLLTAPGLYAALIRRRAGKA